MAFGKTSGGRNFGPNAQIFYFQLKTKDLPEPVFEVKQKQGENLVVVDTGVRFVEGRLIDIQNKEFKHGKKTIKSVSAVFQDTKGGKNEVYFVGIPHTYLGRNILNSLIALQTFDNIQIGVYKSKPKPDLKNPAVMREGFASSAVRQNGQLVYGKFKNEELPPIPKVQVGEETFGDSTKITEFFTAQVAELAKAVKSAAPAYADVPATASSGTASSGGPDAEDIAAAPEGDEPLPF